MNSLRHASILSEAMPAHRSHTCRVLIQLALTDVPMVLAAE